MEKARELQKNICCSFIDYVKASDSLCGSQQTVENYERDGSTQTNFPVSWETCVWVKKPQLEVDMQYPTGSKLGKEQDKAVCCHPAYLTYMQGISCGMPGWMNHNLESRLLREISTTLDMQMIPL